MLSTVLTTIQDSSSSLERTSTGMAEPVSSVKPKQAPTVTAPTTSIGAAVTSRPTTAGGIVVQFNWTLLSIVLGVGVLRSVLVTG